jgi:hypothetical protein
MRDRLPDISINIKSSPRQFLSMLENLATEDPNLQAELHKDLGSEGYDVLNVKGPNESIHQGLVASLIAIPDTVDHVLVEIAAHIWHPDPPTYDAYVEAANLALKPLLTLYNKESGSRLRMSIHSRGSLEPRLPPRAKEAFELFVLAANKSALHPYDWKRFYTFIYLCTPRNINVTSDDVWRLLISSGFSHEKSEYLASIFEHGISLLRQVRI